MPLAGELGGHRTVEKGRAGKATPFVCELSRKVDRPEIMI